MNIVVWFHPVHQVAALEIGAANDTYETLCYRQYEAGECASYGVLSIWGGDESLYLTTVADDERWVPPSSGEG